MGNQTRGARQGFECPDHRHPAREEAQSSGPFVATLGESGSTADSESRSLVQQLDEVASTGARDERDAARPSDDPRTSAGSDLASPLQFSARILVAEDDAERRAYYVHLLRTAGFDVLPMSDGAQALLTARGLAPDLVLTNIELPELSGIELARVLRSDESTRDLPVILLATATTEEECLTALDAGADDCLTSPFSARELLARIRAHLKLSRMRREAAKVLKDLYQTSELARVRAEAASRAKSDFLAVMSHELRTPLNAISGYVQLLEMGTFGEISDTQRSVLGRIDRSQRHLLRLINDVLNLARVESGRVEYTLEAVPVADVISNVLPMVEPQLLTKGLDRTVDVPKSLVVWADREKTQQVLLNLLANAVKFTPTGGSVRVDAQRNGDDGYIELRVSDTGPGIPEDKCLAVFEPFVQVDASRTRQASGTGLGLAISRDLARGMGGDLRLQSVVGRGSTFSLVLPEAVEEGTT
jgi:signal transduction histidine kinase